MTSLNTWTWKKKYILLSNLGSKFNLLMKLASLYYYQRKHFIKKFYKNGNMKTSSRPLLCFKRIKHNLSRKIKLLKQATYIKYVITNLSKFFQINMQVSSDSFLQILFLKLKRAWN